MADDCVACFMISSDAAFFFAHDFRLAFWTDCDALEGLSYISIRNRFAICAGGTDSGFVRNVCEVSTGATSSLRSECIEVDRIVDWFVLEMNFENIDTIFAFWKRYVDVAVEAARTE